MTCSKCAREVAPDEPWCPDCKAPTEFSERERKRMNVDVRARILWGDPTETIREDWRKKGATPTLIDIALREAVQERNRHFRIRGLQDLGMAVLCFLVGALAYWLQQGAVHGEIAIGGKGTAYVMIASVVAPLAGLWLGFRGVRRLASGGAAEKAASDLSEFE